MNVLKSPQEWSQKYGLEVRYAQVIALYKSFQYVKAEHWKTKLMRCRWTDRKFAFAVHVTGLGHARLLQALLQLADNLVSRYTTSNAKHQRHKSSSAVSGAYRPSDLLYKPASTQTGVTPPTTVVAVL